MHIPTAMPATAPELRREWSAERVEGGIGKDGLEVVTPGGPGIVLVTVEDWFGGKGRVAVALGESEPTEKAEISAVELEVFVEELALDDGLDTHKHTSGDPKVSFTWYTGDGRYSKCASLMDFHESECSGNLVVDEGYSGQPRE